MKRTLVVVALLAVLICPEAALTQENPDLRAGGMPPRPMPALLALEAPASTTHYVKPGGASSGACDSWASACELQAALSVAGAGDEIWVQAGTYKPTQESSPPDSRSATFQLVSGVAIYGGFAGTETSREDRDYETNVTTLSGDIGTDDASDNVYHVLTGSHVTETAVLDGFTISGGYARNALKYDDGFGGGLFAYGGELRLENLRFEANEADEWGGGLYINSSDATLTNVTFSGNTALDDGGGMCDNQSTASLTDVTFSGNRAYGNGGGMHNYEASSPTLTNVTFSGNTAIYDGGGMFNYFSSPTLTNVTFSGNRAGYGGGMSNHSSSPALTNVTFSGNTALDYGGGMFNWSSSSPTLANCILWGNDAPYGAQIYNLASEPVIAYSDIQGSGGSGGGWHGDLGTDGGGNIDADPLFLEPVDPAKAPTTAGDLRLRLTSPAIDAGNNEAPGLSGILTDLGGHPRFADVATVVDTGNGAGPIVDMGAYEAPPSPIHVDQAASGGNNGSSWPDAFTDLQDALTWAVGGVEVWVAEGTYLPTTGTDRTATFQLGSGVAIYGGFAGTESSRDQRDPDPATNNTVLSGDIGTSGDNGDNSYHVVSAGSGVTETAVLDGFTISGGNANGSYAYPCRNVCGGGMYNDNSSPTLTGVTFSGNNTATDGGGMYNFNNSPTLTNVTFSGNTATRDGGGMYNDNSSPTLTGVTFSGNTAQYGGGMSNWQSSPTLTDVTFSGNTAGYDGGGMSNYSSSPTLTNVTFSGNTAPYGGGMDNDMSNPTLTNVTFSGNTATNYGGGMVNYNFSNSTLINVTFSGNTANFGGGMDNWYSNPTLANVTFSGNTALDGGGGMYNAASSSPTLTNVTFSGNTATNYGGGMYNRVSSPTLANCILWGNDAYSGTQIYNLDIDSTPYIAYSDVQGSGGSLAWVPGLGTDGGGNIDADPLFVEPVDPATAPTTAGNLRLRHGSPAIDAGNNDLLPAWVITDLDGKPRIVSGVVDMGAYEFQIRVYLPLVFRSAP